MRTQQIGRRPDHTTTPSPRAVQILALLAAGHNKRDIARTLYVSESTVNTHVRNTFELLHTRTTAQAVAVAIGEGLIPAPRRSGDVPVRLPGRDLPDHHRGHGVLAG